jgi:DNA-binding beta-propeller fold protein YncE
VAGLAIDREGNIILCEKRNHRIRKISIHGHVHTLAGNGKFGFADGRASKACFNSPEGVAVDRDGNVIVADTGNHCIRLINCSGEVSTLAGSRVPGRGDGTGRKAHFNTPTAVAINKEGNIIVSDTRNSCIRELTPEGVVSTLTGGRRGFEDGLLAEACFHEPRGLAIDKEGNIFVADFLNDRIRIITPKGRVSTVMGTINLKSPDGNCNRALVRRPWGVAVDAEGGLIVSNDYMIRHIHQGRATSVRELHMPLGIAIDNLGNVVVAESRSDQIMLISGLCAPRMDLPSLITGKACDKHESETLDFANPLLNVVSSESR